MRRGEVWWHEPPDDKARPVLVLTRDVAVPVLQKVVVVPATTTVRGIPTEVPLGPADGLPKECVLSFDNLATVRRAHLVERIALLPPARLRDVCRALRDAVDC